MMDLIDRNKALAETWKQPSYSDPLNVLTEIRERLRALPTIAQPEIIHCGDCRYWKNDHLCERLSRYGTFETESYFYCGFAERREE